MKKLYKQFGNETRYAEAWVRDAECVYHWGVIGSEGESKTSSVGELSDAQAIDDVLKSAVQEGFAEIPRKQQFLIVLNYKTDGEWGNAEDLEHRQMIEESLNECLGWTGNGMCDGGAIGSGSMSVFSYVCLLYTSPSPRDLSTSRMPSSA